MKKIFIYTLAALTLMACGKKETSASQEEERVRYPSRRIFKVISPRT